MKVSEVLNKAADLIEEHGWTTGDEGMAMDGPHCALGSIGAATGTVTVDSIMGYPIYHYVRVAEHPAAVALASHLMVEPTFNGAPVFQWNDAKESAAPVIEALRAAALIEASREDSESKIEAPA